MKRKAPLQTILDGTEEAGRHRVVSSEGQLMDPRRLLLDAANCMSSELEILIKFAEELRKHRSEDIRTNPQYLRLQNAFAKAIRKYPDLVQEFEREFSDKE